MNTPLIKINVLTKYLLWYLPISYIFQDNFFLFACWYCIVDHFKMKKTCYCCVKFQMLISQYQCSTLCKGLSTYLSIPEFEVNSPPGASRHISTLKMSQMVEILFLYLVLIANSYGQGKHRVSTRINRMYFLKRKVFLKKQCQFLYDF